MTPAIATETRQLLEFIYATFEGHYAEITDMVAEGDQVWAKLATHGGHSGEFEGLPPTGKHWTNRGVWFIRVTDGRISASEGMFDVLNHIKQVGGRIVPA
jgi:predicted ester cyclase